MTLRLVPVLAAALLGSAVFAHAGTGAAVPGQKIDSGLGSLPHYSKWIDRSGRDPMASRVPGESLDSGLGELPHYSKWVDPAGRDPLGLERTALGLARQR
jgi:hypothetical protein